MGSKKGSQLRRFKESLSSITTPGELGKKKKKQAPFKDVDRNDKLKNIEEQFNKFGTKFQRAKYPVFGRKVKGQTGKYEASKELAEQKRKNALLKERNRRKRSGGVIDRRFGENDPEMDPETKMLERFGREKQQRARNSSLYNLADDTQLTHLGQSLAEIDDFEGEEMLNVSDDDGEIKQDVVSKVHFGGNFDADSDSEEDNIPEQQKSKAEVMSELIAKSKMYKYERQQQHDEDLEEINALDADLKEIQGLLRQVKPVPQHKAEKPTETVSYDTALREMLQDKRSKPSERTRTDEEIAQEEMERLQELEEARLKRMRGEEEPEENANIAKSKTRREGDDLDDDFIPDEEDEDFYGLGKGAVADESDEEELEEVLPGEEAPDDDDISDAEFDLAQYFTDEEDQVELEDEEEDEIAPATKRLRIQDVSTKTELAYTFPCPSTFDEMLDIIKGVPTAAIPTIIERIQILYSTKLRDENKDKLETFTPIVLQTILHLTTETPIPFNTISDLVVSLHRLTTQFPSALTQDILNAIRLGSKRLSQSQTSSRVFPTGQELVLFYTVGQLYPTSDLMHIIVNPTALFMGQILSQMRIRNVQDLGRGLFVCSLMLEYQRLSKRIVPELVNFINVTLSILTSVANHHIPEIHNQDNLSALSIKSSEISKKDHPKLSVSTLYEAEPDPSTLKVQLLNLAIDLVDISSDLWKSVISFPELFSTTKSLLQTFSETKLYRSLPSTAQSRLKPVLDSLTQRVKLSLGSRAPLALQSHRPIPIPSYLPKFSMAHSFDSKNDPDHDRASLSKLRAQHRREKKSIVHELRKEARTEAIVRSEEGRKKDAVYAEKMKIANGIMRAGNNVGKWERDQKRKRR